MGRKAFGFNREVRSNLVDSRCPRFLLMRRLARESRCGALNSQSGSETHPPDVPDLYISPNSGGSNQFISDIPPSTTIVAPVT